MIIIYKDTPILSWVGVFIYSYGSLYSRFIPYEVQLPDLSLPQSAKGLIPRS